MIHPIVYYISAYLVIGGIGLALASRHVDWSTQQQRGLKYIVYLLIINGVLISIFRNQFSELMALIIAIGFGELLRAVTRTTNRPLLLPVMSLYSVVAASCILFAVQVEREFLLFLYLQVLAFDGFSQVAGQLWGRHPLLPTISPHKTIEGCLGGGLFAIVSAAFTRDWIGVSLISAIGLGLLTSLFALTGDILASYVKRRCQIKDYSQLLPGHGGVLDRFDSWIMTGCGYLWLWLLLRL